MLSTPSGIRTCSRSAHPRKAPFPMCFTLSGISTRLIFGQFRKASSSMRVTPSGITTVSQPVIFVSTLYSVGTSFVLCSTPSVIHHGMMRPPLSFPSIPRPNLPNHPARRRFLRRRMRCFDIPAAWRWLPRIRALPLPQ